MDQSFGALVVTEREGAFLYLLVLHAAGHWDIPKGHPWPGENAEETARREVREETGCDIRLEPGYEDSIEYLLPRGELKRVCFRLARLERSRGMPLPSGEIRAIGWFTLDEARRLITYDNSRGVLLRADAFLRRKA